MQADRPRNCLLVFHRCWLCLHWGYSNRKNDEQPHAVEPGTIQMIENLENKNEAPKRSVLWKAMAFAPESPERIMTVWWSDFQAVINPPKPRTSCHTLARGRKCCSKDRYAWRSIAVWWLGAFQLLHPIPTICSLLTTLSGRHEVSYITIERIYHFTTFGGKLQGHWRSMPGTHQLLYEGHTPQTQIFVSWVDCDPPFRWVCSFHLRPSASTIRQHPITIRVHAWYVCKHGCKDAYTQQQSVGYNI